MGKSIPPPERTAPAETLSTPPPGTPGIAPRRVAERDPSRYEIVREHGRGGIGRVLEAHDGELGRRVAIKELLGSASGDAEERFFREARLTARLEHPAVVPVHDAGRWPDSGRAFYSMKLVSGRSLQALAREATGFEARLALLPNLIAVAEAVAYAHSQRVVHRDLKPANVIVGAYGETIVIDWGLAKDLREREAEGLGGESAAGAGLTVAGSVMGTPSFMSPEQARGEEVDERTDVYSLGAMLYAVLAGTLPHAGEDAMAVLEALRAGPPPALKSREPRVPSDLAAIVDKAMARDRAARYRDAGELAADLKRFQTGQLVGAHEYSPWQLAARWVRRNRAVTLVTLAFVLACAVGAAAFVAREQRLRREAEEARRQADGQTLALLEQNGRIELDLGRPSRAAVYLSEAARRDPDRLALRALLTQAVAPLGAHRVALRGHTRDVIAAAWSPDGTRIATGSADRSVRVWDAATGAQVLELAGHTRWLEDVVFSPDGRWIASVGAGDATIVWDAQSGAKRHAFPFGGFRVAFTPDSRQVLMGSKRGELFVWDVADGRLVSRQQPYRDRLAEFAFRPNAAEAATVSWDGTLTVWDRDWNPIRTHDDHDDDLSTVDYSADGRRLLTGDMSGRLAIRDATTGVVENTFQLPPEARSVRAWFSPDGRTVVTASHDGVFRVWHAASGVLLRAMDAVPRGKMFDAALSPDGRALVTTWLHGADVWSLEHAVSWRFAGGERGRRPTVHPAAVDTVGRAIAGVEDETGTTLHVWDAASGELLRSWPDLGQAHSVAASASRIASVGTDVKPARLWDAEGRLVARLDGHGTRITHDVEVSADGSLFATAGYDRRVLFWRAEDGARTGPEILLDGIATAVAFAPDGTTVAITDEDGRAVLADVRTGARRREWQAHDTWIQDVAFSRDGTRLVTAGRQDHTVKIWDVASGARVHELAGHVHNVMRASFSPDGRLVASVSIDRTARVWDARTGELLRTLPGPTHSAGFASSDRLFTTGVGDYAVIWDFAIDERAPDEIATQVAARSPWRLEDGRLVLVR